MLAHYTYLTVHFTMCKCDNSHARRVSVPVPWQCKSLTHSLDGPGPATTTAAPSVTVWVGSNYSDLFQLNQVLLVCLAAMFSECPLGFLSMAWSRSILEDFQKGFYILDSET